MTDLMKKQLDTFLAEKTSAAVDRSTYLVCGLEDKPNKVHINLVFVRDWHVDSESDEYKQTVIDGAGVVFMLPAYWLMVHKDLVMPFLTYLIEDYYEKELGITSGDESGDSSNGTGSGCNCGGINPPPRPPMPGPNGGGNCCPVING